MDFPLKRTLHAPINGSAISSAYTDFKLPGARPAALWRTSTPRPSTPKSHEANLPGGWVVQKFGGTSVGKFARSIARDIVRAGLKDNRIAVVCSARSSSTKSEGTTNRLLRAAQSAQSPSSTTYIAIIENIKTDHISAASDVITSAGILSSLTLDIESECAALLQLLKSAQHLGEVSPATEDKIVSKGEALSCRFLAALLQDVGVRSVFVDMSEVVKASAVQNHGGAHTDTRLDESFYLRLGLTLGDTIRSVVNATQASSQPKDGEADTDEAMIVPVITGYFGRVPGGLLNSIGRGYTDLCAALVAVGLKAKELQVWKEVDGIFTADPRKVPTAVLLEAVTPSEAAELTFYGSEVIHPFTMEQVIRASIPIRIKNVMNPTRRGTMIFPEPSLYSPSPNNHFTTPNNYATFTPSINGITSPNRFPPIRHFSSTHSPTIHSSRRPKHPTAVTVKHNIVILNVHSNKRTRAHGFLMKIFMALDKYHLTVDLIASSEVHVSMALHSETAMLSETAPNTPPFVGLQTNSSYSAGGDNGTSRDVATDHNDIVAAIDITSPDLLGAVRDLQDIGTIDLVNNMAIVSLVGRELRNMVGISGKMFKTLGDAGVNVEMISQGASEINISCVIDEHDADRALNVLHTNLFTFLD